VAPAVVTLAEPEGWLLFTPIDDFSPQKKGEREPVE